MPPDPRATVLTTAAKEGLRKRKGGKGRQTVQGFRRPVPLSSAAVTTPSQSPNAPHVPTTGSAPRAPLNTNSLITPSRLPNAPSTATRPGLTGDVRETGHPGAPAGSSPALGVLTDQLYKGATKKRKRTGGGQQALAQQQMLQQQIGQQKGLGQRATTDMLTMSRGEANRRIGRRPSVGMANMRNIRLPRDIRE